MTGVFVRQRVDMAVCCYLLMSGRCVWVLSCFSGFIVDGLCVWTGRRVTTVELTKFPSVSVAHSLVASDVLWS